MARGGLGVAKKKKRECSKDHRTCGQVDGASRSCCRCVLLAECREHVRSWEGVIRILASYAADPGNQGQKIIKGKSGHAWECVHCEDVSGYGDETAPTVCKAIKRDGRKCGRRTFKKIPATVNFLAPVPKGPRNVHADSYRVANFKLSVQALAEAVLDDPAGRQLVWLVAIGCGSNPYLGLEYSENAIAAVLGKSRRWVRESIRELKSAYQTDVSISVTCPV